MVEDRELWARLEALDAASLCDGASKAGVAVGVCDPSIDLISAGTKLIGRAHPVVCDVDFLEVFKAFSEAREGEALLIEAASGRAVVGELFASEARRRGLAGIVVDGLVRDEDGVVIIPAGKLDDILPVAEEIQRTEGEILEAIREERDLFAHTNLEDHYRKRADRLPSELSMDPSPEP